MTNKTRGRKQSKDRWIGLIRIDIFRQTVPVFISTEDHIAEAQARGFSTVEPEGPYEAMACCDVDSNGVKHFALVIPPQVFPATWVHEAVHIADYIMDYVGIPSDTSNTEVRAYLTGYIFERLEVIFDEFYMKNPELDPVNKAA